MAIDKVVLLELPLPVTMGMFKPFGIAGWVECLGPWDRDIFRMLLGLEGRIRLSANEVADLVGTHPVHLQLRVQQVLDKFHDVGMPNVIRLEIWDRLNAPFPFEEERKDA